MGLLWEDRAWDNYLYWQKQDRKILKKINELIKDIQRNAFVGIGKPEPLKGVLSGFGVEELMMPIELSTMRKITLFILFLAKVTMKISLLL